MSTTDSTQTAALRQVDTHAESAARAAAIERTIATLADIRERQRSNPDALLLANAVKAVLKEHPVAQAGVECNCRHLSPCPTRQAVAKALGGVA